MKLKIIFITFVSLFFVSIGISQNVYNYHTLDSLRNIYALNHYHYLLSHHPERLPLAKRVIRYRETEQRCVRSYKIPDTTFLKMSPFNADSIIVTRIDNLSDDENSFKVLGKMDKKATAAFADMIYNYDFVFSYDRKVIFQSAGFCDPPEVRILFYHNNQIDSLNIHYVYEGLITSSFLKDQSDNMGETCLDLSERIYNYFKKYFSYEIKTYMPYTRLPDPIITKTNEK